MITAALMQRRLEQQNGLQPQPHIRNFLISRESDRQKLPGCNPHTPEQVFVTDDADDPRLAVFIAEEVLERARTRKPQLGALDDHCVVAEGVSHFLYLTSRAEQDRQVTLLELELQAEVDKFVWLSQELGLEPGSAEQYRLLEQLFDRYSLREQLSGEEVQRYREASKFAAQFCARLAKAPSQPSLLEAARQFFRLPLAGKVAKSR